VLEELQSLIAASGLSDREIAKGTKGLDADGEGLSISTVRGIRTNSKPNPTIQTYALLKAFLESVCGQREAA
jgi:hypothetical protein